MRCHTGTRVCFGRRKCGGRSPAKRWSPSRKCARSAVRNSSPSVSKTGRWSRLPNASNTARSNSEWHTSAARCGIGSAWSTFAAVSSTSSCSRWKASPISIGCPAQSNTGSSLASALQKSTMRCSRSSQASGDGHTHATLSGVSPQPVAVRPARSSTVTRTRAHSARSTTCAPNFSGMRSVVGMKWSSVSRTRMSVGFGMMRKLPKNAAAWQAARCAAVRQIFGSKPFRYSGRAQSFSPAGLSRILPVAGSQRTTVFVR